MLMPKKVKYRKQQRGRMTGKAWRGSNVDFGDEPDAEVDVYAGIRPEIYARNLYANLRTLDKAGGKIILVEEVPEGEKWDAVRDRLRRSASAENIVTYDQDIAAWVADFGEEGGPPG